MFIFLWGLLTLPVCFTVGGPKFGSHLVMGQLQMCSDKPKSRPHAENCQPTRQGFDRFILPHGTPCAAAHGTKSRCQTQFQHLNRGNVPGSAYDCFKPVWSQIRQRVWPCFQKVYPLCKVRWATTWRSSLGVSRISREEVLLLQPSLGCRAFWFKNNVQIHSFSDPSYLRKSRKCNLSLPTKSVGGIGTAGHPLGATPQPRPHWPSLLPHLHIPPNGRGKKKDVEKGNSPERQSSSGRRPGIILEQYFTGSKGVI